MDNVLMFFMSLAVVGVSLAGLGVLCWFVVKIVKAITG